MNLQIDLYMAVSLDGFIADLDDSSDWTADDELFEQTVNNYGCVALGRNTFEQFHGDTYPITGAQHLILSKTVAQSKHDNVSFVQSVEQAIQKAEELGFEKLLVIGGAQTNQAFAEASVLNKILLDIHPLILDDGLKLFGDFTGQMKLKQLSVEPHDTKFIHAEYEIEK